MQSPGALLGGAQRQAGIHLALAGGLGRLGEALALGDVRLLVGRVLGRRQPLLEVGEPGTVLLTRGLEAVAIARSSRSASPRAERACEPY